MDLDPHVCTHWHESGVHMPLGHQLDWPTAGVTLAVTWPVAMKHWPSLGIARPMHEPWAWTCSYHIPYTHASPVYARPYRFIYSRIAA